MEVYSITNNITGEVYIGSTRYNKYYRWGTEGYSGFSHISCMNNGDTRPLYVAMRKYGIDNFELKTLVYLTTDNINELQRREDLEIKRYWDRLGSSMMYNQVRGAYGDIASQNTPEVQAKSLATRLERYGSKAGRCHSPEARSKAKCTNIDRYGSAMGMTNTVEAIAKRSNTYQYKGSTYILKELYSRLLEEGYNLSYYQAKQLANGRLSKKLQETYPELLNSVTIVSKHTRNNNKKSPTRV